MCKCGWELEIGKGAGKGVCTHRSANGNCKCGWRARKDMPKNMPGSTEGASMEHAWEMGECVTPCTGVSTAYREHT